MFLIPRRQIWTQQPQGELTLDKRNPLASTITHCLPLNGSVREIVNGGKLSLASTGAFDVSQIGRSLRGSGAACASIPINLSGYTKLTVSFLMYWDAFANDDKLAMEYGSNFATNSGFLIDPNSSSGGFEAGVASPGFFNSWKCTRPSAAAWHHYYITLNRTTGTAQSSTIAIDGVIQAMTANISVDVTDNFGNNSLYLFSRNNASLFGLGRMANLIIRGGYVGTVSEAKQEFENPWQIFKRPDSRIFVPVSAGGGSVNANASGALSAVAVTAPSASASGGASASGALATITIYSPTATASAGGSANASGSFASLTLAAPNATATASGVGAGSFAALSISPATATATATKSATASGAFATISLSAPNATATGTTAGNAIATATPAQITISHAAAIAIGSAVASGGYQSIGITAPTGSASVGNGNATASGAWAAISITAPAAYASSGFIRAPSGSGPTVIQPGSYRPSNTAGRRY